MITKEKMVWSFIKFSQLILKGNVWRAVWRICMWILGLKGLTVLEAPHVCSVIRFWLISFRCDFLDSWAASATNQLFIHPIQSDQHQEHKRFHWHYKGKVNTTYTAEGFFKGSEFFAVLLQCIIYQLPGMYSCSAWWSSPSLLLLLGDLETLAFP